MVKGIAKIEESSGLAELDLSEKTDDIVNADDQATKTLEKLRAEESVLSEETQNWATLLISLRARIKEEIELKTINVSKLKTERENLKFLCEQLTNAINSGVAEAQHKETKSQ